MRGWVGVLRWVGGPMVFIFGNILVRGRLLLKNTLSLRLEKVLESVFGSTNGAVSDIFILFFQ